MGKRTKTHKPEYDFLSLEVINFAANVAASVSYKARDPRHYDIDANVFEFESCLEINCQSLWPEERAGADYGLTIYGHEIHRGDFSMTLDDCHVEDDVGVRIYRKVGNRQAPVYDVPKGIGFVEKVRGADRWSGCAWVSDGCLSDMLKLLPTVRPLYVSIHERREGKHRSIVGLTLQTENPAEE